MVIEEQHRKKIKLIKSIAIFSVITAHTTSNNIYLTRVYQLIGIIGVPCFFFLSGFLFKREKYSTLKGIKSKLTKLTIPWMILGTTTFIIGNMFGDEIGRATLISWIRYLIGYQSHLYYLSMYLMLILLSRYIPITKKWLKITWIIAIFLYLMDDMIGIHNLYIYPYLNPLHWFIYFYIGQYIRKMHFSKLNSNAKIKARISYLAISITVVLTIVQLFIGDSFISYFSLLSLLFGTSIIMNSYLFLISAKSKRTFYSEIIGENTFIIFLSHIVVIGFLNTIWQSSILFDLLKPIILIQVYVIAISIFNSLKKRNQILNKKSWIIGM